MMEGMGKVRGLWEALAIQYREISEEIGLVRRKGRKPYLEIAALLEMAVALDMKVTTLAQMMIGTYIRSYHIFRRGRIEKAYRLIRMQLKRGERYIKGQNT